MRLTRAVPWRIIKVGGQRKMTKTKKDTNKVSKPHKYRVSLYLGKDLYTKLETMARFLNLPVATFARVLLATGWQLSEAIDTTALKEVSKNGKSKV